MEKYASQYFISGTKTMLCLTIIVPPYPTLTETLNQVGGFRMFLGSEIFPSELSCGGPVYENARQKGRAPTRMGTEPPLFFWHRPEHPIEILGPEIQSVPSPV